MFSLIDRSWSSRNWSRSVAAKFFQLCDIVWPTWSTASSQIMEDDSWKMISFDSHVIDGDQTCHARGIWSKGRWQQITLKGTTFCSGWSVQWQDGIQESGAFPVGHFGQELADIKILKLLNSRKECLSRTIMEFCCAHSALHRTYVDGIADLDHERGPPNVLFLSIWWTMVRLTSWPRSGVDAVALPLPVENFGEVTSDESWFWNKLPLVPSTSSSVCRSI